MDPNRGPARPIVSEIFGIDPVEGPEIALHIRQEHGNINDIFPIRPGIFQNRLHIRKHTVHLRLEIELLEMTIVIKLQARHSAVVRAAFSHPGPYPTQEQ